MILQRLSILIVMLFLFACNNEKNTFLTPVEPEFEVQSLFNNERFPNVVVTKKGTVLVSWGRADFRVRRSTDGGNSWDEPITVVNPGFHGGGTLVDEVSGDIFTFIEGGHPPAEMFIYKSSDDGITWQKQDFNVEPDPNGNLPSLHMNESGITLQRGKYKGRLIRASRYYDQGNKPEFYPNQYTNAVYSDDRGETWKTSAQFPLNGTGEAAIVELDDGTLYYNSRRHHSTDSLSPRWRYSAISTDGGETWENAKISDTLPDGGKDRDYGLMGGLCRLPVDGHDILLFTNIESESGRKNGVVWASFDGGETWPLNRVVDPGSFAYSSITAGRPGTPSEGYIYLFYESDGGAKIARFNMPWLLNGKNINNFLK